MSIRRALRWTLPPLALIALAGWLASPRLSTGAPDSTIAPQQSAGTVPAQGPAAPPPVAAGPDRLAAVQKFVDQKNSESSKQREDFVRAGWQMVDAPPPDRALAPPARPLRQARRQASGIARLFESERRREEADRLHVVLGRPARSQRAARRRARQALFGCPRAARFHHFTRHLHPL